VEAIPYYARALKIRPLYARGWLNLGIAYANLGQYDEAVKAYVQALAISSDAMYVPAQLIVPAAILYFILIIFIFFRHIWDYLESIFTFQRRYDLITLSQSTRDPAALAEKLNFSITTPLYSK
jgi:tetratricopeptide (TPR) repeat protein